jgi:segregation and condensation protein A
MKGGAAAPPEQLTLDLDGFEGPIDLLLSLARAQKVDLARISILALANQYLGFIDERQRLELEVADDYLVMAAILAYLKSCTLLPPPAKDEPELQELAGALRQRLALLEAMQTAGRRLMAGPRLDQDFFFRGAAAAAMPAAIRRWDVGLYELLRAYGERQRRRRAEVLTIAPAPFPSMDEALRLLAPYLGHIAHWRELASFLRPLPGGADWRRGALAATFAAVLELARTGRLELRQDHGFGPIWLRSRAAGDGQEAR